MAQQHKAMTFKQWLIWREKWKRAAWAALFDKLD